MEKISKKEALAKINEFFERRDFSPEEARKIKRLAMKHRIRLGEKKKKFCEKCFSPLRGRIRVSKEQKSILCEKCGHLNKFKLQNY